MQFDIFERQLRQELRRLNTRIPRIVLKHRIPFEMRSQLTRDRILQHFPGRLRQHTRHRVLRDDVKRHQRPERVRRLRRQISRTFKRIGQQRRLDLHRPDLRRIRTRRNRTALQPNLFLRTGLQTIRSRRVQRDTHWQRHRQPLHIRLRQPIRSQRRKLRHMLIHRQPSRRTPSLPIGRDPHARAKRQAVATIQRRHPRAWERRGQHAWL